MKAVTRIDPGDLTLETIESNFTPSESSVQKLGNRAMIFSEFEEGIVHTFRVTDTARVTLFTFRKNDFYITEGYQKKMLLFKKDEGNPTAQVMPFYVLEFDQDNDADIYGGFLRIYTEDGEAIPLPKFCKPFLRLLRTRSVNELICRSYNVSINEITSIPDNKHDPTWR